MQKTDLKKGINIIIKNEITNPDNNNNNVKKYKRRNKKKNNMSDIEKFLKERNLERFKISGGTSSNKTSYIKPQPLPYSIERGSSGNMNQQQITPYQAQLLGILPPPPQQLPALPAPTYNAPTYTSPNINFSPNINLGELFKQGFMGNNYLENTYIEELKQIEEDPVYQLLPVEIQNTILESKILEDANKEAKQAIENSDLSKDLQEEEKKNIETKILTNTIFKRMGTQDANNSALKLNPISEKYGDNELYRENYRNILNKRYDKLVKLIEMEQTNYKKEKKRNKKKMK